MKQHKEMAHPPRLCTKMAFQTHEATQGNGAPTTPVHRRGGCAISLCCFMCLESHFCAQAWWVRHFLVLLHVSGRPFLCTGVVGAPFSCVASCVWKAIFVHRRGGCAIFLCCFMRLEGHFCAQAWWVRHFLVLLHASGRPFLCT